MLSVSVIGGYLGAGKTTLVNHLLRHAGGTRIAVLVNEFGALPIDEDLIDAQDDALISIAGGCVCCSYGNDLIQAMLDLSKLDHKPDHVLIESSGVALPGAIAASVDLLAGFQIDGIVVLADAETIKNQTQNQYVGDTIEQQLADANLVLLNKADLVPEKQLGDVKTWLATMAPDATVITASHADVPNGIITQAFDQTPQDLTQTSRPHVPSFQSRVIGFDAMCDAEYVAKKLADPALSLIRAKGFVPTTAGLRAIQIVGRRWSVSDAPKGAKPGIVVIAQRAEVELQGIENLLRCDKAVI